MPLLTKSYEQFLSDILTFWASIVNLSPNLQSGDPLLAIFQSHVLCGLIFIQSQVVAVNKLTRAATSKGPDLDSWNADFSFPRLPAIKASGTVQFSVRSVLGTNVLIPPGTILQTIDGSIQYDVIADTNQSAWSAIQNAYVLSAGFLQMNATVQAVNAGSASNVQAGALAQIVSVITGISFVTNLAPILNGADPEQDQPYRDRFKMFINAVNARTTPLGILSAARDTPGVVATTLIENQDRYGNFQPGYGVVVIDDGSGSPTSELIAAVTQAVAAVNSPTRGFTIQILVIGPTLENVTTALNVRINPSADQGQVVLNVENAVLDYVNSLEIGVPLMLENISFIARGADPNVTSVQAGSVRINAEAADYLGTNQTIIRTNNLLTVIGIY